jgi:alkylation response protein AidB-like acyl-CoA dehydrogenase
MGESMAIAGFIVASVALIGIAIISTLKAARRRSWHTLLRQAQRDFHIAREWLEAKFVQRAGMQISMAECTFDDDVAYVRSRSTGELSALVAVTIFTETSGPSSYVTGDAVGNLQAGTAVFRFDGHHWVTDGRAILNLNPHETIQQFQNDLEIVGEEVAFR